MNAAIYIESRSINRTTEVACQGPPRGVRIALAFNSCAMARTLVTPALRKSATMGP
jgi:hypothetical protein